MAEFIDLRTFFFSILAYGGGAVAISYLAFTQFAKGWLENLFAKKLDEFRHQQAVELQRLRVEVEALLSGAIKLQDRDFEILPQAWEKLHAAYRALAIATAAFKSYPDLNRAGEVELKEVFEGSGLSRSTIERISNSTDKTREYIDAITRQEIHKVKKEVSELKVYSDRMSIFLPLTLKESLDKITEELWSAVIDKEMGHEEKDWKVQRAALKKLSSEITPMFNEIKSDIHGRLRSHGNK
jgi:hypothetical protein